MSKIVIVIPPAPGLFDQRSNVPLGPLYIASVLEQEGHEVGLVSLLGHDIPASWPEADLYAMGFTTPQLGVSKGILGLIRGQYPEAKVLAAGAHPTALPSETLLAGFDSVLIGEAEATILQVLSDLPDMQRIYYGVPCSDLDSIPFPARHLLPQEDVYNLSTAIQVDKASYVACITGSRGCPGRCAFCSNPRLPSRYRSAENILSEMKEIYDIGITHFKFQDDTFTMRPSHVIALGEAVGDVFDPGQISTRVITRVDTFSEKIVHALRQLSTEVVSFGIESGSQKVLDISNKGTSVERAELALALARDSGFKTWGFFLFGLPGECEQSVDETIEFLRRNKSNLDYGILSIFVPYSGCDIEKHPEKYHVHIIDRDWNRYWTVQKRTVLALPYDVSFTKMMDLREKTLNAFVELGYARPEWEHDL